MLSTANKNNNYERGERDMVDEGDSCGIGVAPLHSPVSCSPLVPSVVQRVGTLSGERAYRVENFVCATKPGEAASAAFSAFPPTPPGVPFVPLPNERTDSAKTF